MNVFNGEPVSDKCPSEPTRKREADRIVQDAFDRYHVWLHRFVTLRLGSETDADDVVQDVYVRLMQHPDHEKLTLTKSLLRRIVINLLNDQYRNEKVRLANSHVSTEDVQLASRTATPEEALASKEGMSVLQGVFDRLNANCQKAFVLHRFKGMTYDQIGEEMGISKNMVKKHITHALKQFRRKALYEL
ncbi:MAG: RNA polymerase sigma factor [Deltaproteobacteria bacterium]|nr:RNA polymerase sigma factor [Deltaproteobacteria bacterium]